jgi:hypothetical protein
MDISKQLTKEIKNLNLELPKDYTRFVEVREELQDRYADNMKKGRVRELDIIYEKEREYFTEGNQGYEFNNVMKAHYDLYYKHIKKFLTFEQEKYYRKDMEVQAKRQFIFNVDV